MKINLGCGEKYLKGYINCDIVPTIKIDKIFDHNSFPYPFKSSSSDYILMDNVLEHLNDVTGVMNECFRILKPGGRIKILVPYAKSDGAFQDPTHVHYFTENSMNYFVAGFDYSYYSKTRFILNKAELFSDNKTKISKLRAFLPFKRMLNYVFFNIYDGILFELEKAK